MATSESHHWYAVDGTPVYTVEGSGGKQVNPDIRHARKYKLLPGVSGIIKCAAAPGLENWKRNQVLLSALTLPRIKGESLDDFSARVLEDSTKQAREAADRGTLIHAAIERAMRGEKFDSAYQKHVTAAIDTIREHYGENLKCEQTFGNSVLGYGGKMDVSRITEDEIVVLDLKTKEFMDTDSRMAWDEHAMQLAAYAAAHGALTKARCANIFISATSPGLIHVHEWSQQDLQRAYGMFLGLRDYWQEKNKYVP